MGVSWRRWIHWTRYRFTSQPQKQSIPFLPSPEGRGLHSMRVTSDEFDGNDLGDGPRLVPGVLPTVGLGPWPAVATDHPRLSSLARLFGTAGQACQSSMGFRLAILERDRRSRHSFELPAWGWPAFTSSQWHRDPSERRDRRELPDLPAGDDRYRRPLARRPSD